MDLGAAPITSGVPYVSVVIDTYNYGRFVVEAVESVRGQTFPAAETEIIVVDDGSTDDTASRLEPYGDAIRYVRKENGGQASAFNVGIARARGEVIAFLDADDLWRPDKLERVVVEFRRRSTVDVVGHYMDVVDAGGGLVGRCPDGPVFFEPSPLAGYVAGEWPFLPPTSGCAVRTDCLRRMPQIPEEFRVCADLYLIGVLPFHAREFRLIDEPLGSYRIHGGNHWSGTTGVKNPGAMIDVYRSVFRYVERAARERGYDTRALEQRYDALVAVSAIAVAKQEGRRFEAMRRAWAMRIPGRNGRLNGVGRRAMRACGTLLPPEALAWVRRRRIRALGTGGGSR